jgi:hypothetical protein
VLIYIYMGSQVIKAPPYSASDIFYINAIPLVCVCSDMSFGSQC